MVSPSSLYRNCSALQASKCIIIYRQMNSLELSAFLELVELILHFYGNVKRLQIAIAIKQLKKFNIFFLLMHNTQRTHKYARLSFCINTDLQNNSQYKLLRVLFFLYNQYFKEMITITRLHQKQQIFQQKHKNNNYIGSC